MAAALEHPRGSSLPARLARLGFSDVGPAASTVARLGLDDSPGAATLAAVGAAADPDLALRALAALLDAGAPGLLGELATSAGLRERLLTVLGASRGLGDHLVRHPADWQLLAGPGLPRPSAVGLRRRLLAAVGADPDRSLPWGSGGAVAAAEPTPGALRTAWLRAVLPLAAADLTGRLLLDDVAADLSDLAEAGLEAALAVAAAQLPATAAPVRLAVVAMGKCGGRELNYVSDVDVVFVAEPLAGQPEGPALRSATRLAAGLVATAGRELFAVDAGLRPEGSAGPLVRTLASHEAYYRRWAQPWELQALLKARPVAGDLALGREYLERVAPLVWTSQAVPDLPAAVQAMRRRVEADLAGRMPGDDPARELKLGPGGLRDVEFSVQLLQLVHGRSDPALRSPATLPALGALREGGYVGRADAADLAAAYRWLRTVEHRLQLQRLRRTHLLPAAGDEAATRWLARSMGFAGDARRTAGEAFTASRRRHAGTVRRLQGELLYRPLLEAVARLPSDAARLTEPAAAQRLDALGFADTRAALHHLRALTSGLSRRAAIQRTLLPVLLGWFAQEADPDAGLLAFRRMSDAIGDAPWYLRSLRDGGIAADRLAHLLARSHYAADLLVRDPDGVRLLDDRAALAPRGEVTLALELTTAAARVESWEEAVAVARALRREELLRTCLADLLGHLDLPGVQAALTAVATATVAAAVATATRKVEVELRHPLPVRVAVIAVGRLGGGELGYASDADVVFVHEPLPSVDPSAAAAAASAVAEEARRLLALPSSDPPLTLDPGLRPEGSGGALSASLGAFARYHATRVQPWERQALLRARVLLGDAGLGARFLDQIAPVRWPVALDVESAEEVRRLRRRVLEERAAPGLRPAERWRDVKLGPGGMADVEWVVQLLALQHAHAVPGLRTPRTLPALAAAVEAGLVVPGDAAVLAAGWSTAARLRDAVTLVTGRHVDVLPAEGRALDGVRRVAGTDVVDGWSRQAADVADLAARLLRS